MAKYCVCIKNKRPIKNVPGETMIFHDINNNILISHPSYLVAYQDEYEIWELYQEINMFWGWNTKPKTSVGTVVHVIHAI